MSIEHSARTHVTVILPTDDAIAGTDDERLEAWKAYQVDGYNERLLSFVPGKTPTRYHLERPGYDQRNVAYDLDGMAQALYLFQRCVARITGYRVLTESGVKELPPVVRMERAGERIISEKWMRDAGLPGLVITAVAGVARSLGEGDIPFSVLSERLSTPTASDGSPEKSESERPPSLTATG